MSAAKVAMTATDWKPLQRNSLQGFFTLHMASGLVLHECSFHQKDGKSWVGLPGKPQVTSEGKHRTDQNGKRLYTPVVEIPDKEARARFQTAALAAVSTLLGEGV